MARSMTRATLGLLDEYERELDGVAVRDAVHSPLATKAVPREGRFGLAALGIPDTDLVATLWQRVAEEAGRLLNVARSSPDEDQLARERAVGRGEHGA